MLERFFLRPAILALVFLSLAIALFNFKYKSQNRALFLRKILNQIKEEQENIHILKLEFAYLTQQFKIEKIIEHKMNLVPITGKNIVCDANLIREIQNFTNRTDLLYNGG